MRRICPFYLPNLLIMKYLKYTLLLSACLGIMTLHAQKNTYSWQLGLNLGMTNYHGDLSQSLLSSAPVLEKGNASSTPAALGASVFLEKQLSPAWGLRLDAGYGTLSDSDRALNFRTEVRSADLLMVYHFDNGVLLSRQATFAPYLFAGVGLTDFGVWGDLFTANEQRYYYWSDQSIRNLAENDPLAETAQIIERDGEFETRLDGLQTEGKAYDTRVWHIPMGLGIQARLSDRWSLGVQTTVRYTATDYLDDVSGRYALAYDNPLQAYAGNPGDVNIAETPYRGNENGNRDWYSSTFLSLTYRLGLTLRKYKAVQLHVRPSSKSTSLETPTASEPVAMQTDPVPVAIAAEADSPQIQQPVAPALQPEKVPAAEVAVRPETVTEVPASALMTVPASPAGSDTVWIKKPAIESPAPVEPPAITSLESQLKTLQATMTEEQLTQDSSLLELGRQLEQVKGRLNTLEGEEESPQRTRNEFEAKKELAQISEQLELLTAQRMQERSNQEAEKRNNQQVNQAVDDQTQQELRRLETEVERLRIAAQQQARAAELSAREEKDAELLAAKTSQAQQIDSLTNQLAALQEQEKTAAAAQNTSELDTLRKEIDKLKAQQAEQNRQQAAAERLQMQQELEQLKLTGVQAREAAEAAYAAQTLQLQAEIARLKARQEAEKQALEDSLKRVKAEALRQPEKQEVLGLSQAYVFFKNGSAEVRPSDKKLLDTLAKQLIAHENLQLLLRGYADKSGSRTLNLALSNKRVESVRQYLLSQGVDENRLQGAAMGDAESTALDDALERKVELELRVIPPSQP